MELLLSALGLIKDDGKVKITGRLGARGVYAALGFLTAMATEFVVNKKGKEDGSENAI